MVSRSTFLNKDVFIFQTSQVLVRLPSILAKVSKGIMPTSACRASWIEPGSLAKKKTSQLHGVIPKNFTTLGPRNYGALLLQAVQATWQKSGVCQVCQVNQSFVKTQRCFAWTLSDFSSCTYSSDRNPTEVFTESQLGVAKTLMLNISNK